MRFDLSKQADKTRFKERANYLYEKGVIVDLTQKRELRTIQQNRYLHLILGWFGLETGYTMEEVKQDIFKRDWCKEFFEVEKKGRKVYRSTADLNTLEMTNAIEKFRNLSSQQGIYLAAPNETDFLNQMEYQINQFGNRQYI